jgi:S-layer homology domain
MVAVLAVLVGGIAIGSATTSVVWANHTFPDVPTSSPFHGDIAWAAEHDIVNGKPDGLYHPNEAVSRQAIAAMLHRYNNSFEVVHHGGSISSNTFGLNTVTCPTGKRPLSGGGSTDSANLFMTDMAIGTTSLTVRWESDDNALISATTDAWALCAPTT